MDKGGHRGIQHMDNFHVSTLQHGQDPHQYTGLIRENEVKQNSPDPACMVSTEEGNLPQPKESMVLPLPKALAFALPRWIRKMHMSVGY